MAHGGVQRRTIQHAMGWTMLYLFVFLKLPIVAACWIVWWAVKQTTDTDDVTHGRRVAAPAPSAPAPAAPAPAAQRRSGVWRAPRPPPPRTRSVTAAGRARELASESGLPRPP